MFRSRALERKKICVWVEENCAFIEKFIYVGMLDKLTVIHQGSLLNGRLLTTWKDILRLQIVKTVSGCGR
jgi:hypothetical protein